MNGFICLSVLIAVTGCSVSSKDSTGSTSEVSRVDKDRPTREAILDAVIQETLRSGPDPDYGTPGQMRLALASDSPTAWPRDYVPILEGYRVEYRRLDSPRSSDEDHIMGIRLDQFFYPGPRFDDVDDDKPDPDSAVVVITVLNLGGTRNGNIIGGCHMTFQLKRTGKHWVAECTYSIDG